jgi:hypothetical protein
MNEEKPKYGVYVIFRGALAFHDDPESSVIDVYMPEVVPHVYKAGSWGAEKTIHCLRELLALTGLPLAPASRSNSMRGHENVINVSAPIVPGADYRARIRMPRPSRIFYRKKVLVKVAIGVQPAKDVWWGQVPVFAYESEGDGMALTGRTFHWIPDPDGCGVPEPKPIILSILATGEEIGADLGPALAGEMFGERVHIWDPDPNVHSHDPGDAIEGLDPDTLKRVDMTLPRQMMLMRNISALLRSGNVRDIEKEAAHTLSPEDKTSCGPVGGG